MTTESKETSHGVLSNATSEKRRHTFLKMQSSLPSMGSIDEETKYNHYSNNSIVRAERRRTLSSVSSGGYSEKSVTMTTNPNTPASSFLSLDPNNLESDDEEDSPFHLRRKHSVAELRLRYSGTSIPEPNDVFLKKFRLSFSSGSNHMGPWNIRTIDSPRKKEFLQSWSDALHQTYGETPTIEAAEQFLAIHGVTASEIGNEEWIEWQDALKSVVSNPSSAFNSPQPAHTKHIDSKLSPKISPTYASGSDTSSSNMDSPGTTHGDLTLSFQVESTIHDSSSSNQDISLNTLDRSFSSGLSLNRSRGTSISSTGADSVGSTSTAGTNNEILNARSRLRSTSNASISSVGSNHTTQSQKSMGRNTTSSSNTVTLHSLSSSSGSEKKTIVAKGGSLGLASSLAKRNSDSKTSLSSSSSSSSSSVVRSSSSSVKSAPIPIPISNPNSARNSLNERTSATQRSSLSGQERTSTSKISTTATTSTKTWSYKQKQQQKQQELQEQQLQQQQKPLQLQQPRSSSLNSTSDDIISVSHQYSSGQITSLTAPSAYSPRSEFGSSPRGSNLTNRGSDISSSPSVANSVATSVGSSVTESNLSSSSSSSSNSSSDSSSSSSSSNSGVSNSTTVSGDSIHSPLQITEDTIRLPRIKAPLVIIDDSYMTQSALSKPTAMTPPNYSNNQQNNQQNRSSTSIFWCCFGSGRPKPSAVASSSGSTGTPSMSSSSSSSSSSTPSSPTSNSSISNMNQQQQQQQSKNVISTASSSNQEIEIPTVLTHSLENVVNMLQDNRINQTETDETLSTKQDGSVRSALHLKDTYDS